MGLAVSTCFASAKDAVDITQEKVVSVVCCRKGRGGAGLSYSGKHRYGSLAGGKYDESDDEDAKGILYNNNLLLDDDDDEEEQIVILTTKEKTAKPEQRTNAAKPNVDHSVFTDGQGLLDMMAPTALDSTSSAASAK